jgi:hypothetical protein
LNNKTNRNKAKEKKYDFRLTFVISKISGKEKKSFYRFKKNTPYCFKSFFISSYATPPSLAFLKNKTKKIILIRNCQKQKQKKIMNKYFLQKSSFGMERKNLIQKVSIFFSKKKS